MTIDFQKGHKNNYTLGRGELLFGKYLAVTSTQTERFKPGPFRFLGNAPNFSLSVSEETLEHYSSTHGIREQDESVPLQVDRTGSCVLEDISPENLEMFFSGQVSVVSAAPTGIPVNETFVASPGDNIQLGITDAIPQGLRNLQASNFQLDDGAQSNPTVYNAGTHYFLDEARGMIQIADPQPTATPIAANATLKATYSWDTSKSYQRIISGFGHIEGALRFRERNASGVDRDYFMPRVEIMPNGELEFIGESWKSIPLTLKILLPEGGGQAIYIEGQLY